MTKSVERDPEVLGLFIEESTEALVRVEQLLLDAEHGRPAEDLCTQVFRDLHTIKGTSGYLALPQILALSHAGEELLSRLRDQPSAATTEHFGTLLVVVEVLRRMVERVRTSNDEGEEEGLTSLVAQLEGLAERVTHEAPSAPSSPPPAAAVTAAPVAAAPPPPPALAVPTPPAAVAASTPSALSPAPTTPAANAANAAAPASALGAEAAPPRAEADGTVRVSVGVLDRLMNLMGELVLSRNQIVQILKGSRDIGAQTVCQRLSVVTSELQEQIMKTRMQPVARVFEKVPRMVRDLAKATDKRVGCTIDGNATEIDKAVIEAIRDPVMHAVRNAIDHGIELPEDRRRAGKPESGTLSVRAFHEAGTVTIEIADDGRGIDPKRVAAHALSKGLLTASEAAALSDREAIELIFRPGFSTAAQVTQISGRGVGMDVVRSQVERAGGQVEVESVVGRGTALRMKMPLTLAIIPALMVRSGDQRFAIPQVNLTELLHLTPEQAAHGIERVRGSPVYRLRGEILPLVDLAGTLRSRPPKDPAADGVDVVVVEAGNCRYGLVVDEIRDTEEIVVKPLHGALKRLSCYAGATVLGDGGVALILELSGLAALAGLSATQHRELARADKVVAGSATQTLLVFTAGEGTPCAVPLGLVTRLERLKPQAIERVAGQEVVQYREHLMPVVRPETLLPLGSPPLREEQQLLVFDFGRVVALAVDEIIDVVTVELKDEAFEGRAPYTQARIVAFGKTTLVLDAFGLVRAAVPELVPERRRGAPRRPLVVVADESGSLRTALSSHLRAHGFEVVEAATGEALTQALKGVGRLAALVLDPSFEALSAGTVEQLHREHRLPVLLWGGEEQDARCVALLRAGAQGWVPKFDRDGVTAQLEAFGAQQRRRAEDQAHTQTRAA
jgi:two-component system chemotaxis sensor kinase CheA